MEAVGKLDKMLEGQKFVAGDCITIADHSLVATISTIKETRIAMDSYPNVLAWLQRCEDLMPGYNEANGKGARQCAAYIGASGAISGSKDNGKGKF